MAGETIASLVERLRNWPKPKTHEERVEDAIDRLMLVEAFIMWYIAELEDLRLQLSKDPVLILLVPIVEKMISQLWQLMRRWSVVKAEVIRKTKEGLMRKERKIEGNGYTIRITYHKNIIDITINLLGGHGDNIRIPDLGIDLNVVKAMRAGWRAADASDAVDRYPSMRTNHVWQAILWLISMPSAEAYIYADGISVSKDGVKPTWQLYVNGTSIEWPDDKSAYEEMAKLPKELFLISLLHAAFGDGSNDTRRRLINLGNDDRNVLELVAKKLKDELGISGTIYSSWGGKFWSYGVHGRSAKILAEAIIKAMEELVPQIKSLYDLLASYELIGLRKWGNIIRMSKYVSGESKVQFVGLLWTPDFREGGIALKVTTADARYAEKIKEATKAQGINAIISKRKLGGREYYNVVINWSRLKGHLCNPELRTELIKAAQKAIENCYVWNLMHPNAKKDCSKIRAAKWLQKLNNNEWLKKNLKCGEV